MATRYFALVFGIVFLIIGIAGFTPWSLHAVYADAPHLVIDSGYGLLFGLFPVNVLLNILHLLFGILGLAAFGGYWAARGYAQLVAISYAVLAVFGLIPVLNTTFGLAPLYGNDVWLHAGLALVAAFFAFSPAPVHRRTAV